MTLYRRSVLFLLACDPVARLWSGHGNLTVSSNAVEVSDQTYQGAGALIDVPTIRQLLNGVADRIEFQLSGVSAETFRLAADDRATVKGAACYIGEIGFDTDWQVSGEPEWFFRGVADVMTLDSSNTEGGRSRVIKLSVAAGDTRRSNPTPAYFTDAAQKRNHPTDNFFDRVAGISLSTTRRFGPK